MTIATPEDVLNFWLRETPTERRFKRDPTLDAAIAERFGETHHALAAEVAPKWRAAPRPLLAAIIVLDQFSRNLHRGDAQAFAQDRIARVLTREALAQGWDAQMSVEERQFLYMPVMHGEDAEDQRESVALFEALGEPEALDFARRHAAQIDLFGRFPQRNAALGRQSTAAELELLRQPGATF